MTCQYSFARLRATVMQRQMQGLKRAFLRLCNTCNTYAYAMPHARRRGRMPARIRLTYLLVLLVLQVLHSLKENGGFPPFHVSDLRKGAQGHGLLVQGSVLCVGVST